ncbi:hypothetical protein DP107_16305 [Haloglomus irregulare]|jgi:hypothetical protein|uniref:Lipoprotein n=1 Tax=Haloglomus irregulare TaxID=2234134 RepID=A0A554MW10_9EURY|nr:hypothetical protein [Haloglomus irregulare]TSD09307.1 hypothetical protein DP107_16305 [Haloglomus irregulare]
MQRSSLAALALALLLVTAGCNGLALGDGGDGGDGSDGGDGATGSALPGVEDGEVTNTTALLAAHQQGLVDAGFENRVRVNATVVQQDRVTDVQRSQQTVVEAGGGEYQYRTVNGGGSGFVRFDHWGNRSVWVTRGQVGNTTRYQVRDQAAPMRSLSGAALLGTYLNGSAATAAETREEDGRTLTVFETTTPPADANALPVNRSQVEAYEARFVVDSQGRIHTFVAEGSYELRGEVRTFRIGYETQRLDAPSVSQPDWTGEALRNRNG